MLAATILSVVSLMLPAQDYDYICPRGSISDIEVVRNTQILPQTRFGRKGWRFGRKVIVERDGRCFDVWNMSRRKVYVRFYRER